MRGDNLPRVSVIGLGYIGLPTAAVIARAGMEVHGVDVSRRVVEIINRGEIHIEEVDLDGLVQGVVQRGLLRAGTEVEPADVFVIAVPTPFHKDVDHTPDLSYVLAAAGSVGAALQAAQALKSGVDIQIEVETIAQLHEALDAGAVSVLLDNFSEAQMREAVAVNASRALLEVSGGVTLDQLRWIAATGVDRISIGSLTKDVRATDYSMRVLGPA